ncbi:O-antigen ligase family protein [Urechidicola vernalis]|uniref:O-antigen ligase family protein n=1 Tax=Urechidicola vernalis TaxID=3075600 RepID=A0ABU2Y223_9FLAO|nr:O-antigen ligase family protein [Urechidicola sp. P050]MDT0552258.1 O-antigen ligase family protein [Urechidicola sp. P050]
MTSKKYLLNINLLLVALHMALGILLLNRTISKTLNITLFVIAFTSIIITKNKNQEAVLWSAYVVGSEVLFRMSKGLLFYEFPKYMVLIFLITGLIVEKKRHGVSPVYIIYILLLLIGITFSDIPYPESIRTNIVFNLSGPILLGICGLYMYHRKISKATMLNILKYMGLPIISMVAYIFFKTPDLQEIVFGGVSNRAASGGYGPNQVASILGIGVFIFSIYLLVSKKFSGFLILDVIILIYISYRGLVTLSRGGLITGVFAITVFAVFYLLSRKNTIYHVLKYFILLLGAAIPLFLYTSNVTGGMLLNRYTNKNARGVAKTDISAGRVTIFKNELEGFFENPFFGMGVGTGKYKRIDELGYRVASHNEMSRLLGEHGLIGLFIIFLLLVVPLLNMYKQPLEDRAYLSAFLIFWFLTINHSAMRLAMPAFLYGLSLMTISNKKTIILERINP